jgi:16S rRNA G966 N2-methylase RsmD
MRYLFARDRVNYEDYASGRVLYGKRGNPSFPIRLASEVFQRCLQLGRELGAPDPCVLYDPCCGAAYHLCTLGYLHPEQIDTIIASDIDPDALALARRNLGLLSREGLAQRIAEIEAMSRAFGKQSHAEALGSARLLQGRLDAAGAARPIETRLFLADATDRRALTGQLARQRVDIVFADVPYGWHTQWTGRRIDLAERDRSPLWLMLDALHHVLLQSSIVAVASSKDQRARHPGYDQLQRHRAGKRQITILRPAR